MNQLLEDYSTLYDSILSSSKAEIVSYGISDKYVPNWTEKESLTEYIANFYDENNTNFTIKTVDNNAVVIEDESERGIKPEDLAFGNSNSREFTYKIGTHGEGFKLGALVLCRLGKKVLIDTIGHTIAFYLEYEKELDSKVLKTKIVPNQRTKGSSIYLETNLVEDVKNRFLFLNENLQSDNDFLYKQNNNDNYIFVNTLGSQKIKSAFSYSIHKKQQVNRDRNMIESPCHDIAIQLFTSNDKELLKEWFAGLPQDIHNYFEYEIIKYFVENRRKAFFKNTKITLLEEAAREFPVFFYHLETNADILNLMYANPEVKFICSYSEIIKQFFRDIVKCSYFYYNDEKYELNASLLKNDEYSYLLSQSYYRMSDNDMFRRFIETFDSLKMVKSFSVKDNVMVMNFNPKVNINLHKGTVLRGKTTKDKNFTNIIEFIAHLVKRKSIQINGWDYSIKEHQNRILFSIHDFPQSLTINIKSEEIQNIVKENVRFFDKKVIVKDAVFQTPNTQYLFLDNGDVMKEINSQFSYIKSYVEKSFYIGELLGNKKYMSKIFSSLNNPDTISFELQMIERFITEQTNNFARYISNSSGIKKNISQLFVKKYGINSCISTDDNSDKTAIYYGYKVINLPYELAELFELLETNLSSQITGVASIDYDVIQKPSHHTYESYLNSPYINLVKSCLLLESVLEEVFQEISLSYTNYNIMMPPFKDLLPSEKTLNDTEQNLVNHRYATKTSFKKSLRTYIFIVFNKSHVVSSFDKPTTNGLCNGQNIFIKDYNGFIGTFFHEYIHLSTGLKDIDQQFEKVLSFVSVLGFKHKDVINEKNISNFIKEYGVFSKG